jgi:hypothetical protein
LFFLGSFVSFHSPSFFLGWFLFGRSSSFSSQY